VRHTGYLVVSAGGDMRVLKRLSAGLRTDEVAFKVTINVPDGWQTVRGDIEVQMPEPPAEAVLSELPE
jgi:hypothetical protein